jgi:cytidylate kinase
VSGEVPVIAVDGPSGSGKGTICARVADVLGWHLLDSGALYRIVACEAIERGVALDDEAALTTLVKALDIEFRGEHIRVDGVERSAAIRTEAVGAGASRVAALGSVRAALVTRQRGFQRPPGLVADGRDMGTAIFPAARLKIFLDATAEERAKRRYNQLKNKGLVVSLRDLVVALEERDARDKERAVSPLRPAEDAVLIDSTHLSIDQVVERVLELAQQRGLRGAKT